MAGVDAAAIPAAPARGRQRSWVVLLMLPILVFLLIFFLVPYANMVYISFMVKPSEGTYLRQFTLANYARALGDVFYWRVLRNTFWYALLTTAVTLMLGYPLAYHIARASRRARAWLLVLLISPLLVSVIVRSFGWMIILGRVGLINQLMKRWGGPELALMYNPFGIIVGLVHVYLPFMALSIAGSLQTISPDVERAARSLGAGPWHAFWRVTWPLSLPGVFAGTLLVFVLAVSSYVIPILLGGNNVLVMPMIVVQMMLDAFNWPLGAALSMVLFGLTAALLWGYAKLLNRALRWTVR
ncbi:MAG: ABC transporter permease [Armatimonadota bacterium]|nr:ABC transporter permease [Armatimonadota bacterium]